MITNYGKFMDALAIAFDTNLSGDEICDFVKYELEHMPDWKFESYALSGDSGYEFCHLAQANGSVVYQNDIILGESFAKSRVGDPILFINSLDKLGIAINQGSFASAYHILSGDSWQVRIRKELH